ncbi:MAG: hypothetical protein NT007_19180 [Candidatus Kapabacteria bacterium]|nr:hypothetical protein [Candidatus Kapabacteria bacterium]
MKKLNSLEAVSKTTYLTKMSFLRMQESPSSATLGDSCMRRNDKKLKFSHRLMRRNDRNEVFETASK